MYLVFDIGATKIRLAISPDGQNLSEPEIVPTPQDFNEGIKVITETAQKLAGGEKIDKVAGAVRFLDKTKTKIKSHPHIPLWSNQPLKETLENAFSAPVVLENDAALAGLGEAIYGAGKNYNIVAYLTISTGVGGAKIENKKIDENSLGFEPGFQIIDKDQLLTLEDLVSGYGLEKRYGKKGEDINDPAVWNEVTKNLAVGIYNSILYWSPDVVILGGSVVKSLDLEKIKNYLKETNEILPELPEIKKAQLGDSSALWGALACINNSR